MTQIIHREEWKCNWSRTARCCPSSCAAAALSSPASAWATWASWPWTWCSPPSAGSSSSRWCHRFTTRQLFRCAGRTPWPRRAAASAAPCSSTTAPPPSWPCCSSGQFCADLVSWAQELGLQQLVCLTSSLAHERQECQLTGTSFRYVATDGAKVPDNFVKLEPKASLHGLPVDSGVEELYLPGSGAALELYRLGRELGKLEVVVPMMTPGPLNGSA